MLDNLLLHTLTGHEWLGCDLAVTHVNAINFFECYEICIAPYAASELEVQRHLWVTYQLHESVMLGVRPTTL